MPQAARAVAAARAAYRDAQPDVIKRDCPPQDTGELLSTTARYWPRPGDLFGIIIGSPPSKSTLQRWLFDPGSTHS